MQPSKFEAGRRSIQILDNLYTIPGKPLRVIRYNDVNSLSDSVIPSMTELASYDEDRRRFSIANLKNNSIFVIGGWTDTVINTVLAFQI